MAGGIPKPSLPDPKAAAGGARRNPFKLSAEDPQPAPASPKPAEPEAAPALTPAATPSPTTAHMGSSDGVRQRSRAVRSKRPANTTDVLLSLPRELHERLESVIAYTYPVTGVRTKQAFLRAAIERACQEHEDQYNGGRRWPDVPKQTR